VGFERAVKKMRPRGAFLGPGVIAAKRRRESHSLRHKIKKA